MVVWAKAMPRSAIIWTRSRELTKLECQIPPDNDFLVKMPTLDLKRSCAEMGSVICGHYPRPPFSSVCTRTFKSFYQPDLRQYYEFAKGVRFRFQTTGQGDTCAKWFIRSCARIAMRRSSWYSISTNSCASKAELLWKKRRSLVERYL